MGPPSSDLRLRKGPGSREAFLEDRYELVDRKVPAKIAADRGMAGPRRGGAEVDYMRSD